MRRTLFRLFLMGLIAIPVSVASAQQQQPGLPTPRLDSIFPMGAKAGTTVAELTLTGTDIEETKALYFSHPGIKAEIIPVDPPKVDPKNPKKQPPPAPKGPNKFKVTVAADVPPGQYDVRVVNRWGMSNPRYFVVGETNEVLEKEPNNDDMNALKVEVNTTINGVINAATDVDYCVFNGKKDQRIVLSCLTSSIDSRARPQIQVFDNSGKILSSNYNYRHRDALTDVILPADGDYIVRLSEFTYTQGGPQYFYRLTISTAPWIDAIYPPMIEPGKPSQVTLYGRNLPGGVIEPGAMIDRRPLERATVTITPPTDPQAANRLTYRGLVMPASALLDGFEYRIKGPGGISNPFLITFATAPVQLEKTGNDTPETAQALTVPGELAGRIDNRGDRDYYVFDAKKGDVFSIDLWSERLGYAQDLYFTVRNLKAMSESPEQDDTIDSLHPQRFLSRTTDPATYKFTATEDGKYLVHINSRSSSYQFGPHMIYRLRIRPEAPDFRLIAMAAGQSTPDCMILNPEGRNYLDVFVSRHDGFAGPITLTVDGLPAGVTCPPQTIPAGQKQATLVLTTAGTATATEARIVIKGSATINGKSVVRDARSASIVWAAQQNVPTITRLDDGFSIAIRDKAPFRVDLELDKAFVKKEEKLLAPLTVKPGDKLTVPFKIARFGDLKGPIILQQFATGQNPQQTPVTVNNGQAMPALAPDKNEGTIILDVKPTAPAGIYNIVLKGSMTTQFVKDPNTKKAQNVTIVQTTMPIALKVLPVSVAKVAVTGPKGSLKQGTKGEIVVKVTRECDYQGEYKVKLVLPMGKKGVSAAEATIPAGKNEVNLMLDVAGDAPTGTMANVVVLVNAMVEGKFPYTSEGKFNLTIEKTAPPKK